MIHNAQPCDDYIYHLIVLRIIENNIKNYFFIFTSHRMSILQNFLQDKFHKILNRTQC